MKKVAKALGLTEPLVTMYLPYEKVVYDLEEKSGAAKRTQRWREEREVTSSDQQQSFSLPDVPEAI